MGAAEPEVRATELSTGEAFESMFDYLQGVLLKLEAAQGCIDEEARQGLELLRAKTKELEVAQARRANPDAATLVPIPESINDKIDEIEGDLSELEHQLEKMDVVAKQLVSHSTSLWLADAEKPPQSPTTA